MHAKDVIALFGGATATAARLNQRAERPWALSSAAVRQWALRGKIPAAWGLTVRAAILADGIAVADGVPPVVEREPASVRLDNAPPVCGSRHRAAA